MSSKYKENSQQSVPFYRVIEWQTHQECDKCVLRDIMPMYYIKCKNAYLGSSQHAHYKKPQISWN